MKNKNIVSSSVSSSNIELETISSRIAKAIGKESVASFARRSKLGESLLRQYIAGTMPGADKLEPIATAAGVNVEWLATGKGPMRPGDKQLCLADEFVYIKKARARLSGGDGCWAQEDFYDEFYSFRLDWIKTVVLAPEKAILMDVTGNSMAPKIKDGDTAMIDTGRTEIIDGRVYAFADTRTTDQFELRIKALYNVGDENILIESYNVPESLRTQTRPRGDIKVVGEVVWIGRALVPRQGL